MIVQKLIEKYEKNSRDTVLSITADILNIALPIELIPGSIGRYTLHQRIVKELAPHIKKVYGRSFDLIAGLLS